MAQSFTDTRVPDCLSLREVIGELREITDWFGLGLQLGVPKPTLSVFEQKFLGDVQQCKMETIDYWLLHSDSPSWSDVITAVEEMGMYGKLSISLREKGSTNETTLDLSNPLQSEVQNKLTNTHSASPTHSNPVPKKELPIETKCIESSFNLLFHLVFLAVKDNGVTTRDFTLLLHGMKALEPVHVHSHIPLLAAVLPTLYTVSNLAEVFDVLRGYCSWFNYHVLEWIIEEYCPRDQTIKKAQQIFEEELRKYYKHQVRTLPKKNHFGFEKRRSSSMVVQCNEEWETIQVEQLAYICQSITEILKIKKRTLYLISVEEQEGSVTLNFALPPFVANAILPLSGEQQSAFRESHVTSLRCGSQHYQFLKHIEDGNLISRSRERVTCTPKRIQKYSPGGFKYIPTHNNGEDNLSAGQEEPEHELLASYTSYEEPQHQQRSVCVRARGPLAAVGVIVIIIAVVVTVAVVAGVIGQ